MTTFVTAILAGFLGALVARVWYRHWRRRRLAARRKVEKPNSHYSSSGVRNQEDRERWGSINVRALHPLNRDEVERLLTVVDREGIKALSSKDRLFLDNMTLPRLG